MQVREVFEQFKMQDYSLFIISFYFYLGWIGEVEYSLTDSERNAAADSLMDSMLEERNSLGCPPAMSKARHAQEKYDTGP